MKKYRLKVKHDNGTCNFLVIADSKENARKQLCAAENCPDCAIQSCREVINKPVWKVPKGEKAIS